MLKQQKGFTLIELVIVIVILGILAATAAPKFIDLSSDAQEATLKAAAGAMQSAAVITFAQNKAAVPWTSILNNVDLDDTITGEESCSIVAGDCFATLTFSGSTVSQSVVVSSTLCSGC